MPQHETKICPRCNSCFECKVGDVANCQCSQVTVSDDTRKFLLKTNYDCLCKNCLEEINQLVKVSKAHPFPTTRELLLEGLHYYKENGSVVFTKMYHFMRGYCCKNGCRHCPYGNAKTK